MFPRFLSLAIIAGDTSSQVSFHSFPIFLSENIQQRGLQHHPMTAPLAVTNFVGGETVYQVGQIIFLWNDGKPSQRSILVLGTCAAVSGETDYSGVYTSNSDGRTIWPYQTWPVAEGEFKALCILSPGENLLSFGHYHNGKKISNTRMILTYIPLLQTPPLYLAILIAKDSPLVIDCPPAKRGRISTAHSALDAAIQKFRMTAYMWQAIIAEEMKETHLGRRTFRLEEEWDSETLTMDRKFCSTLHMQSTAKVHLVRTEKTVAELYHISSTESVDGKTTLSDVFRDALQKYGPPFESSRSPMVAGIVLDTFSTQVHGFTPSTGQSTRAQKDLSSKKSSFVLNREDPCISRAIFSRQWTCTWPRFVEEIASCLLDSSFDDRFNKGQKVWEACAISQAEFLAKVGKAVAQ